MHEPLMEFFAKYKDATDVFCLQEILKEAVGKDLDSLTNESGSRLCPELYSDIEKMLQDHVGYFVPNVDSYFGNAVFVRKNIEVASHGEELLYKTPRFPDASNPMADHDRKAQWLIAKKDNIQYCIVNVHGHWTDGKKDTPDRLEQSRRLVELLSKISESPSLAVVPALVSAPVCVPKIVCGDFNIDPDTESTRYIESVGGLANLITKHEIKTTRNELYDGSHQFADYIFVSPEIVSDTSAYEFQVLQEVVSDHAGLRLSFSALLRSPLC